MLVKFLMRKTPLSQKIIKNEYAKLKYRINYSVHRWMSESLTKAQVIDSKTNCICNIIIYSIK